MSNKTIIIGGGIIGLSLGWQLARKGEEVEIYESGRAGTGASYAAAGMLAPQAEMGFEDIELFYLCRKSLEMYSRFSEELFADSGILVEAERTGCILPAFDRDDNERLRRLYDFREKIGMPVVWLSGTEAREVEPFLSPRCTGAIWINDDAQINNRKLLEALKIAFQKCGGKLFENHKVEEIIFADGKTSGVIVNDKEVYCTNVVVAGGSWSKQIGGLPENLLPQVRPVKGQIINLKLNDSCRVTKVVRAPDVYLLPKSDGRLILGASVEEMGFDVDPTAGEIFRLLERGWEAVPSIYDLPIESIDVGLRPGSRDHMPIIGDSDVEGLFFATGHYRNGILLTPITAYELSGWIQTGNSSEALKGFGISRFYEETA
ncbi:MAG: glycine oxidase ThiO [Ignavibacteria bacterium]|nr:glycine oxidase ThiO [Ignavibacteria bacterium]